MNRFLYLLFLLVVLFICLGLIYIFILVKPSNNHDWEVGSARLPQFKFEGNLVSIKGVRDYHYAPRKITSFDYVDRQVDVSKIDKVWFIFEPFQIQPFTNFKGVAHTYFVFDFTDQPPIAVSVEARREKGEKYDAFKGLFNQYELIYIWGTEGDETTRRVILENNKLYMYPLKISKKGAQSLFLHLARSSQELEQHPRFYNTLTSNCTNELAKSANRVKPNAIPNNLALIFPGYSIEELYKLRFLPNALSLEELKRRYYISDIVRKIYNQNDFSRQLRFSLQLN